MAYISIDPGLREKLDSGYLYAKLHRHFLHKLFHDFTDCFHYIGSKTEELPSGHNAERQTVFGEFQTSYEQCCICKKIRHGQFRIH